MTIPNFNNQNARPISDRLPNDDRNRKTASQTEETTNTSTPRSITSLGGDKFIFNGQTMSMQELIMTLELERANNLESQLADELSSMAALNEKLKQANDMLAIARQEKSALGGSGNSEASEEMVTFMKENNIEQGISKYDRDKKNNSNYANGEQGVADNGYNFIMNSDEWEQTIENIKAFIDNLNSRSQLEMIRVSSLMKKRDESLTMPSNTNNNIHQTNQGILSKI